MKIGGHPLQLHSLLRHRLLALALVLLLAHVLLWTVVHLRPGHIAISLWIFGPRLLLAAAAILAIVTIVALIVRAPRLPSFLALICLVAAGLASLGGYNVYPSSHDGHPSSVFFQLPLDGTIAMMNGGATPEVNYHVEYPDQRWAYDLGVREGGLLHRGDGGSLEDYYAYGRIVRSPAEGTVVSALDGEPNEPIRGGRFARVMAGNHVVIQVAPREFLFMGHMAPGSLRVHAGDHVVAGQEIGAIGNSGRSSFPHLHLHLQDTPELSWGEGIPMPFHHYLVDGRIVESGIPTGGEQRQYVTNARP